jgi:putative peptidoglycan lipid II flippase
MRWLARRRSLSGLLDTFVPAWKAWMSSTQRSANTRLVGAVMTVGTLTVLVKMGAAGKDVLVAFQFGLGDALDAFLIALVLPQFLVNVVSGSLNAALVPSYMCVRDRLGPEAGQSLLSTVVFCSATLLIGLSVLLAVTAAYVLPLLALGFSDEKLRLTTYLYYWLLPMLLFSGLSTTWGAILNTLDRFALPAIVPLITSLSTIVAVVTLTGEWAIYALAGGMVLGMAVEALILGIALLKEGVWPFPSWHGMTSDLKEVFRQFGPAMAGNVLMGSTALIGQSMAAILGPGSVAAFNYGAKITTLLLSVGSIAVSTAILPHFSRMVAACQWEAVRQTLTVAIRYIALVSVPLTLVLIYFSEPIIRLCFQRGAFTAHDAELVSYVQMLFALQIPFYAISIVAVRLLSALKANQVTMWGTVINLVVSVILNYLLIQWYGVAGLALSVSLMYLVSMTYLLTMAVLSLRGTQSTHGVVTQMATN